MDDKWTHLQDIQYNIWEFAEEKIDKIQYHNEDYNVSIDLDVLEDRVQNVDEYSLSEYWYKKWGPNVWMGMLCYEPWYIVLQNYLGTEEEIWKELLQYNFYIDRHTGTAIFIHSPRSKLYAWLRARSTDTQVIHDISLVFRQAMNYVLDKSEDVWAFESNLIEEEEEE
jgi:hypothetical protein